MEKGEYFDALLRLPNTVFSLKDIALLWGESIGNALRARVHYYLKQNKLIHLHHGLYAKDKNYNPFELAVKINTPSYVSFETVLGKAGVIFQHYQTVFVASYLSRTIACQEYTFEFRKIKSTILTNPLGIEHKDQYAIACQERALLDILYLNKDYYFDNLHGMNWDRIFSILPIYENKRMVKMVEQIYQQYKENL